MNKSIPWARLHGTPTGYTKGCRCQPCRNAWAYYARRVRRAKKNQPPVCLQTEGLAAITRIPLSKDNDTA